MSKKLSITVIPVILTGLLLIIIFKLQELAPFGVNSLASMDARIQYIDFFCILERSTGRKSGSILYIQ